MVQRLGSVTGVIPTPVDSAAIAAVGQEREHCQQSQKQCDDSLFSYSLLHKNSLHSRNEKKSPGSEKFLEPGGLNELHINMVSVHVTSPQPAPSSGIPAGRAHTYIMSADYLAWPLSRWYLSPGPFPQTRLRRSGCPAFVVQVIVSPDSQGMDLAKIIVRSTIVRRNAAISIPQTCIGEVTRSLASVALPVPLIDLDAQADGRNFQGTQAAVGVIKV